MEKKVVKMEKILVKMEKVESGENGENSRENGEIIVTILIDLLTTNQAAHGGQGTGRITKTSAA